MKKFIKTMSLVTILGLSLYTFTACEQKQEAEATTVMNIEVNPEVEFVLDGNGNVVSVSANNEEGNLVITAEEFKDIEGKSAEEAAELFISVTSDLGFIVEGNAKFGDNEIEISISGDATEAKALYDEIKAEVTDFLSSENIQATISQLETVTKAELEELLLECQPYLDAAEVKAMEYKELVKSIAESRKETAQMYSEEIKKAYYEAKQFALEQAELEVLKQNLTSFAQTAVNGLNAVYTELVDQVEELRYNSLIKEDSLYQKALASFREKKIEYLNYRNYVASLPEGEVSQEQLDRLAQLDQVVESAETVLEEAGENANKIIDELKVSLKSAYDKILQALKSFEVDASKHLDAISQAQKDAINTFTTSFETKNAEAQANAKKALDDMRNQLGKTPENN